MSKRAKFRIDQAIQQKLRIKHNVACSEVMECFANVTLGFLEDTREDHKTDPPTYWFVEQTDAGRNLFVAFMKVGDEIVVKTAFEPTEARIKLYKKVASK